MTATKQETTQREIYCLSDDLIMQIRQVIQLSLLTGTDIVNHFRQFRLEKSKEDPQKLFLTEEYKQAFQKMVEAMSEEAEREYSKQIQEAKPEDFGNKQEEEWQ